MVDDIERIDERLQRMPSKPNLTYRVIDNVWVISEQKTPYNSPHKGGIISDAKGKVSKAIRGIRARISGKYREQELEKANEPDQLYQQA
jgi:hypothetical protein